MTVSFHNPDTLVAPQGRYSHVAVAEGARIVSLAGQVGVRADGSLAGPDVASQVRQAYANVGLALESAGATWRDVTRIGVFVVSTELLPELGEARQAIYDELFPEGPSAYPPGTLLVVSGLAAPELLVEVEATAVVG